MKLSNELINSMIKERSMPEEIIPVILNKISKQIINNFVELTNLYSDILYVAEAYSSLEDEYMDEFIDSLSCIKFSKSELKEIINTREKQRKENKQHAQHSIERRQSLAFIKD